MVLAGKDSLMSSLWLMVVTCMLRSSYCRCLKLIASNSPCWFRCQEKTMRSYPLSSRKNTQGRGSRSTAFCMRLAWSRSGSSRPAADAATARLALHPIGSGLPVVGSVMRYSPAWRRCPTGRDGGGSTVRCPRASRPSDSARPCPRVQARGYLRHLRALRRDGKHSA